MSDYLDKPFCLFINAKNGEKCQECGDPDWEGLCKNHWFTQSRLSDAVRESRQAQLDLILPPLEEKTISLLTSQAENYYSPELNAEMKKVEDRFAPQEAGLKAQIAAMQAQLDPILQQRKAAEDVIKSQYEKFVAEKVRPEFLRIKDTSGCSRWLSSNRISVSTLLVRRF